jgi:hypothetical protein
MGSLNLMAAHAQWASRPADERFWSLKELQDTLVARNQRTTEVNMPMKGLQAVVVKGGDGASEKGDLCVIGKRNNPAQLSHFAFNQLAGVCDFPANPLRSLKPETAALVLNERLAALPDDTDAQVLVYQNGTTLVRGVTRDLSRLWNLEVVNRLIPATQNGWMVPPARPNGHDPRARPATKADILPNQGDFGLSVKEGDMIAPAGVYEGDRDMFIFLVNPSRVIDDGMKGLMRGVFIWNSEVGAGAFKVRTFLVENVCGNHICWGASKVVDLRMVHRGEKIKDFGSKMVVQLREYADGASREEEMMVKKSRTFVLGKDRAEVIDNLFNNKQVGLTKRDIEDAFDTAEHWEHTAKAAPTTAWGFVHGLTRFSQTKAFADQRNELDKAGGRILALAAGGKSYN